MNPFFTDQEKRGDSVRAWQLRMRVHVSVIDPACTAAVRHVPELNHGLTSSEMLVISLQNGLHLLLS